MKKVGIARFASAALAVALSVSAASLLQAQEIRGFINGEKTSVKGVIESRNGDLMTIRTQKNALATDARADSGTGRQSGRALPLDAGGTAEQAGRLGEGACSPGCAKF
jgi:hypothetical protein